MYIFSYLIAKLVFSTEFCVLLDFQEKCGVCVDNVTASFAWYNFNFHSDFNFLWIISSLSPAPFSIGCLSEIVQNNNQFLTSLEFSNRGKSLISASKGISHCSSNSKPRKCSYCFFSCMTCGSGTKKLCIRRLIIYSMSKCPSVVPLPIAWAAQASCACVCAVCCVSLLSLWSTELSVMLWSVHMQSPTGYRSINSDCTSTDHLPEVWYFLEAPASAQVSWRKFRNLWYLDSDDVQRFAFLCWAKYILYCFKHLYVFWYVFLFILNKSEKC